MTDLPAVVHPIPSGTRDVLPEELRERRAVLRALREAFEAHDYGEVSTPAVEFQAVLDRAGIDPAGDGARPRYRTIDEHGDTLVLRSDMTVPIARLVATRFPDAAPPLRLSYVAACYRGVLAGRGEAREVLQAGIELCGAGSPHGTVEALTVLVAALDACGLGEARIALGDAALYPHLLRESGVGGTAEARILHELHTRDHVGLLREVRAAGLDDATAALLVRVAALRGGPEVLEDLGDPRAEAACASLRGLVADLPGAVADRVVLDLGLARGFGYYTGVVFDVLGPAQGRPIGGGGRYDELLGRFGRPMPAVGFALDVDALHTALVGQARGRWRVRPGAAAGAGVPGARPARTTEAEAGA